MAWAMSASLANVKRPIEFFLPTASAMTWADATTWSGAFNLSVGCTKFRAVVMIKNFLAGASTGNALPIVTLEAGDTTTFTNRCIVDAKTVYPIDGQLGVATSSITYYTLEGSIFNTTKQFAAVYFRTPTGNANFAAFGACTFDGQIDATP